jgi:hypothetical protein
MAIDERARHRLYERLEAVLGPDEASILMEHLPPVGWADVATKRDLDALASATKRDLDAFEAGVRRELDLLHRGIEGLRVDVHQTRTILIALFAAVVSMGGLAFAAARLT